MSVTFNQFLSRIDEANIAGSRRRPKGNDILTPEERARVSTKRNRSPIERTGGGVSYVSVAPEIEAPPEPQRPTSPKQYVQKWIPGFPPPKDMKVKKPLKTNLNKPPKQPKTPKPKTRQLTLRLREFVNLYKSSLLNP